MTADGPISLGELASWPVTRLTGVGPRKVEGLASLGIENLLDLLTYYPRRYVDRTREARIRDLAVGEEAMVIVTVQRTTSRRTRGRPPKVLVTSDVGDDSGRLRVSFFNQAWRERQLMPGTTVALFGKLEMFNGRRQMTNPVVDLIGDRTGRIVPIYPQSEKARLSTWEIGDWVAQALRRAAPRGLADPVPGWVLDRHDLVTRGEAFAGIHAPDSMDHMRVARRRLVLDELLRVQLALVQRKRHVERTTRGLSQATEGPLLDAFVERLPFELTPDQRAAVAEIARDLAAPHPMHRLLQGDVGSGKTVVAVWTLLAAVQGGHQGAFMAPTEVLAEQHAQGIRALLDGVEVPDDGASLFGARPVRVELLTNKVGAADRRRILAGLASGEVDVAIGTHALIQEGVDFRSLGAVVIDEQHRFGVEQRAALRDKSGGGPVPDVLVMTATPIPRTAAMTVYGDLDVTLIRSLPAGRQPIATSWARTEADEADVWDAVRREVAAGRQAYVVTPLIEESDKLEVRSAEDTYARLAEGELSGLRLGLLHGRLGSADKEATMHQFREGRLDVLVATTVIEVGVDVPNATVMVILDADRFGIAQLHQLRGRVGRGSERSWCYLVSASDSDEAEARLGALVKTTDGFALAEVDLDLRGEGTIMGERQKGRSDLKLASLRRDRDWVERARAVAFAIVDGDEPDDAGGGRGLERHPDLLAEVALFLDEDDQEFLLKG
ncbi:MAG TPA: ATP-dependent DNA helicase RecG [Acidimicrobiales bacterium]|nr:ATP-dependent DNA helicase RecG [Acidimicrobiales bacterium]